MSDVEDAVPNSFGPIRISTIPTCLAETTTVHCLLVSSSKCSMQDVLYFSVSTERGMTWTVVRMKLTIHSQTSAMNMLPRRRRQLRRNNSKEFQLNKDKLTKYTRELHFLFCFFQYFSDEIKNDKTLEA